MTGLLSLTRRNCKLFFKDRGMFITSLITPMILLVLYATFLGDVFKDTFAMNLKDIATVSDELINGLVGGQLVSSLLAVCCVTVAFCSNLLMVNDKVTGTRGDLTTSPIKASTLSLSYFFASAISTLIICFATYGICLVYLASIGWYMSFADIMLSIFDVFLLVLFGTSLSSLINFGLSTQGHASAVGTIISSGYGFICGAYMPISSFGEGLQNVISFLPGTYGTSLIRNHSMRGTFAALEREAGVPRQFIDSLRDSIDCNLYFFGEKVSISMMYTVIIGTTVLLIGAYIAVNAIKMKKSK